MRNIFDLSGKTAVIVGVGGLGGAQALGFADYGADIVLADYKVDHLSEIAHEIEKKGRKVLTLEVQISDQQSVQNMVDKILSEFPRIDILANSAGINKPTSDNLTPIEGWQQVMDVNLKGTFLCSHIVSQEMVKQKSGKIINISSIKGWYGPKGGPPKPPEGKDEPTGGRLNAYGLSKGAVNTLTRSLAAEVAEYNISVNAIAPTMMETPLVKVALDDPESYERIKATIPMGRWGVPGDIVGLSVFLASNASDFVTGQIIYLDGGHCCCA